jgi:hypothetical protein
MDPKTGFNLYAVTTRKVSSPTEFYLDPAHYDGKSDFELVVDDRTVKQKERKERTCTQKKRGICTDFNFERKEEYKHSD